MMRSSKPAVGLIVLLGLLGLGCRTLSTAALSETETETEAEVELQAGQLETGGETRSAGEATAPFLLPAEELAETFVLRQTVTVRWTDEGAQAQEASFEAAVQRQGSSLLLLGLGPMGRVGFTLSLEGGQVSFENRTGQVLPFAPARMLADVQRVYYPWLEDVSACSDCVRRGTRGGFEIEEHRMQGRVSRRRFVPLGTRSGEAEGGEKGDLAARLGIDVRYSGDLGFAGLPLDARLRDEALGYEVELKTLGLDWID